MKKNVLHITPHMGGGVGKALSGLTAFNNGNWRHEIHLLDIPQKTNFIEVCKKNEVPLSIGMNQETISDKISRADVVQIEWWAHPLSFYFLSEFLKEPCRLLLWCHTSGCTFPFMPFHFTQIASAVFTSPYSLENPFWTERERKKAALSCPVVHSSGGFDGIAAKNLREKESFIVGYIGTLLPSKIHPDFIKFCKAADIPGARFVLVGDAENEIFWRNKALEENLQAPLEFLGYTNDIYSVLSNFDVFGYPLNPRHFGTTENALLEAMTAGICPVCLRQNAEKHIIIHEKTGLLVDNAEEYGNAVRYLYNNPDERKRMGNNAKLDVLSRFSLEKTAEGMESVYEALVRQPARHYDFTKSIGLTPAEWFLVCLSPEDKIPFQTSLEIWPQTSAETEKQIRSSHHTFRESSKGSIPQFLSFFPNDPILKYWDRILVNNPRGDL